MESSTTMYLYNFLEHILEGFSSKTVLLNIHEFTVEGCTFADLLCMTEDIKEA